MKSLYVRKLIWVFILVCTGCVVGHATVTLKLVRTDDPTSGALAVQPGSSFTLDALVDGLAEEALSNFDLTLAVLPEGFFLESFLTTLPSGWLEFSNEAQRQYGGANFSGVDISDNAVLVRYLLTAGETGGEFAIGFADQGFFQRLGSDYGEIEFTQSGALITVVPEPATWVFMAAVLVLVSLPRRRVRLASIRQRGRGACSEDHIICQ